MRRALSTLSKLNTARPGRDMAGEVEAVGSNVTQFKPGEAIFGAGAGAFAGTSQPEFWPCWRS